ncbi:MAG TPA: hypothetical protein VGH80_12370 [Xanthomonadaceae bacterium]|jgi:hypothetical protein
MDTRMRPMFTKPTRRQVALELTAALIASRPDLVVGEMSFAAHAAVQLYRLVLGEARKLLPETE